MKIKSKSDVITNSSNEVFCFKMDEDYEELKREIPEIVFTEFKTWDDIRKYVTDENYWEWDLTRWAQCEHGEGAVEPKHDFYGGYENREFIDALKNSGKTDDEIWEFFKEGYENILGYAFLYLGEGSRDVSWKDKYETWEHSKYINKLKTYLTSNFKPGDILSVKERFGNFKKLVIIKYCGDLNVDNPYSSEVNEEAYKKEGLVDALLGCLDYLTATKATEEQISEYNKFYGK